MSSSLRFEQKRQKYTEVPRFQRCTAGAARWSLSGSGGRWAGFSAGMHKGDQAVAGPNVVPRRTAASVCRCLLRSHEDKAGFPDRLAENPRIDQSLVNVQQVYSRCTGRCTKGVQQVYGKSVRQVYSVRRVQQGGCTAGVQSGREGAVQAYLAWTASLGPQGHIAWPCYYVWPAPRRSTAP